MLVFILFLNKDKIYCEKTGQIIALVRVGIVKREVCLTMGFPSNLVNILFYTRPPSPQRQCA